MPAYAGVLGQFLFVEILGDSARIHCADILVLARKIPHRGTVFGIHSRINRVVIHHRLAYHIRNSGTGYFPAFSAVEKFGHLLGIIVEGGIECESVVPGLEYVHSDGDVHTCVLEGTHVC